MVILKSYVDDLAQSARTKPAIVVDTIVTAAADLKLALTQAGFVISSKTLIVASQHSLGQEAHRRLSDIGLKVNLVQDARDLGVGNTAGARRTAKLVKQRIGKAKARAVRVARLVRIQHKATKLHNTGVRPQGTWGITAIGAPPSTVQQLRVIAAKNTGVTTAGRCATTAIALVHGPHNDPAVQVRLQSVKDWLAMWVKLPEEDKALIRATWAQAYRKLQTTPRWGKVRGPRAATIATLLDIKWKPVAPDFWHAPNDTVWHFTEAIGSFFLNELQASIEKELWLKAATHMWGQGLQEGVDFTVAKKVLVLLAETEKVSERGMILTSLCAGCWPRTRLFDAGKVEEPTCPRCKTAPETLLHRYWQCPANVDIQSPAFTDSERYRVLYDDSTQCFWLRGLVPKAWTAIAPDPVWKQRQQGVFVDCKPYGGDLFTDGSGGANTEDPRTRRCGWAVVAACQGPDGGARCIGALWGTLGEGIQTVPRAELYAVYMAIKHSTGTTTIYSDCKYVVDGFHKGKGLTIHGSHGDLWSLLWEACQARTGQVTVVKVKAHTDEDAVQEGRISKYHQQGHRISDTYAGEGAKMHQVDPDIVAQIQDTDVMAARVLQRLLAINLACAKEFPTQANKRSRADPQPASQPRRSGGTQAAVLKQLAELGHVICPQGNNNTIKCQRCYGHRPLTEAKTWVLAGQCPGPPTSSTGPPGLPQPPPAGAAPTPAFGRGTIDKSHRTTIIKGVLFCWGCGAYAVKRVSTLSKPCVPTEVTQQRRNRVRQGLTPIPRMQWPEP